MSKDGTELVGGGKNRFSFSLISLLLFAVFLFFACGGGGSGANTDPTTSSWVTITGTLSATASKPSLGGSTQLYAISSWAKAQLDVYDASGSVRSSGSGRSDGSYSLLVPPGSNYFVRVWNGNLVLKAFVPSVSAATTVNVNTTTTAEVLVLARKLGVANLGDWSVNAASAIASVNMTALVSQIHTNTRLPTLASLLATEISNNYDANGIAAGATPPLGADSASVTATVTTIAGTISGGTTGADTGTGTGTSVAPPAAPTGISVTSAGSGMVTVNWTAVTGATSYNVYYGPSTTYSNGWQNGTKVTGVTSGVTTIAGLTDGMSYYFLVTAVNAGGETASHEINSGPQTYVPSMVTTAVASCGRCAAAIMLDWGNTYGATSYNVYYSTTPGVTTASPTKVTGIVAPTSGITISLLYGTTYYFVVTAVYSWGESAASMEVSATTQLAGPGVPTGVTATAGNGQVTLSWNSVAGATSYNVYYGTSSYYVNPGNWSEFVSPKIANATSGNAITGLTNGTTYYFYVTAVNAVGESDLSGEEAVTAPHISVPDAPTGTTATAGNGQVTLSWNSVAGATSYNVYYRHSGSGGTQVANATSGNAITGLTNGTTYYFYVAAVNAGGESAYASALSVSATPQGP